MTSSTTAGRSSVDAQATTGRTTQLSSGIAEADPSALSHADRIGAEQVAALFRTVTLGVSGAALGAAVLAFSLHSLDLVDGVAGLAWSGYIAACALVHIALRARYQRAKPIGDWRHWARLFTLICLAEGLGWGAGSLLLANHGDFSTGLLIMVVAFGVAAGAVPAFSPYQPAFLAFFLPTTLPFALASFGGDTPIQQVAFLLMAVFIPGVGALGVLAGRSFAELIGLRLRTEDLAEDLRRQKELAERANLAKSSFLAAASHDLRQPIHALGLFVGALRGIEMPAEARRIVEQIDLSTTAMDGLFSALLDISRLDAGVVEVRRRAFEIAPLIERIRRDHLEEAARKGIELVHVHSALTVDSDPLLIERVVRNLVSNAVRHTRRGRVVVGCRRRRGMLAIQVWDTGPGIPPDEQDRIFQEYYQLGNAERDRAKGLGLGLAIVRRLTLLLDCPLSLRSWPGRGSCFEIMLEIGAALEERDEPPKSEAGALATGLVVVVEDEKAIRVAMSALLTGWGHDVITAGSGRAAIRQLATCPSRPDLIISDYRLRNGESGIDVIERLRSEYNEPIPAMLITGDTAPDRLAEAQATGLLLLHKPVPNGKLRAAIANLIVAPGGAA